MDETWLRERTFDHRDFADLAALGARKASSGLSVSVGLPTLNVAKTLGPILDVCQGLKEESGLIDQLAIIDSRSVDETVEIALARGVEVYFDDEILPDLPPAAGKGEALWKSLAVLKGDLIIWIDSDIANFDARFIYGLLGPLLTFPEIGYIKPFYRRPLIGASGGREENEGGRVTEVCVRPLLSMFWPELANLIQPLSGESGGRRQILESVPFFTDYAVEVGLLVNILRRHGLLSMAQVDLEERVHTNQPLHKLGRMSFAIMQAIWRLLREDGLVMEKPPYARRETFAVVDGRYVPVSEEIGVVERPPLATLDIDRAGDFTEA